ncbi:PAS domain-containing protein [Marinobacter salinisoli]|uniref:histidine kinase n=1 Tax=Marinobacter salinisoli TaxID=2769486 RepID=A0ABX7MSH1_9GAMM|nr:PAS domain-containing protein [Marinobacter salinisoli]QSP95335.1 PAS domain-containing protein [Marinobacter salinisoli]
MKAPDVPQNEPQRQAALERTGLLDSDSEARFDRFTRMACKMFSVPIALVSLVDNNRQWFKSCQGLAVPETPRDISFCGHAILQSDLFIVEDTRADPRFNDNPLVAGEPNIRFYAGAPLHSQDGYRLGTLCLIDRQPRTLDSEDQQLLRELADCVEQEINRHDTARLFDNIRQSERRARAVIEGTRVGTWEWNVQTGETVFNERWAEICGYRLTELAPVSIQTWLDLAHPEDLLESNRLLNDHFAARTEEYDCRCRMRHKHGYWVWVHARGRVFEWADDGQPLKMYGTHADVTAETNILEKTQQQNTALSILNTLALDPATDDDARIRKALDMGADYLDMELAIVSEIVGEVYTVLWYRAPGDTTLTEGQQFSLGETYCSLMINKRDSLSIAHMAQSSYREHHCYSQFGLESYLAAPIYLNDRLFGTLNFSSPRPRPQGFSDTEETFVRLLARWVTGVIERRTSLQTLTKLVEQTPGMLYQYRLWPDGSSAFPFSGPGIREIYGVDSQQVAEDASPVFNRIHPEDLEAVAESITVSAQNLSVWQHQYRVKPDGERWRWVEGRATPELLADKSIMWHGYITDIDEKKRIQLALQESEEELRHLFELSPIGITLSDYHRDRFLDVNQALLEPSGYSREEFMALNFNQLLPEGERTMRDRALSELKAQGRYGPFEQLIRRRDGSTYPALIRGFRIINSSGRSLVWSLVEDISERKKVEQMKNEFIATISHELRTPLTSIAGSLGLIHGGAFGELPEQVNRLIAIAARNGDQLKHLIDDLLDMEKLVSGKMPIRLRTEHVSPMIRDCIERLQTYAVDSQISVRFRDNYPDQALMIDPKLMQQGLTNLLSNAIKFSPQQSEVVVSTEFHGDRFRIEVTDLGPGIPESFRSQIFQKFSQADGSDRRAKGGTGLGLAITREIMTQLGGTVGFESTEGQGATFWLEIPAKLSTVSANPCQA